MTAGAGRSTSTCSGDDLDTLRGWPEDAAAGLPPYVGPVLWIAGESSAYVRDEHAATMERHFPKVRRVTVKNAGHWVHSEQPAVFVEVLRRFLACPAGRGASRSVPDWRAR